MNLKTYVVNLKESVDRREHILKETSAFPFLDVELVEAVDGRQLSEEEKERLFDRKRFGWHNCRPPLDGEIGCTLSHRQCYQKLLDSKKPYALILEDDACFIKPEETQYLLQEGISLLEKKKADLVLYISSMIYYSPGRSLDEIHKAYRIYAAYETCTYLVSPRAAKRLLKEKRPFIVADDFKWMNQKGLKIVNLYPNMVVGLSSVNKMESIISYATRWDESIIPPFLYKLNRKKDDYYLRVLLKLGILKKQRFR